MSSGFNRILRRFADDLPRPEYRRTCDELRRVAARLRGFGLEVREDFARDWENAHVLLELDRTVQERPDVRQVVDLGGGNSPMCYRLAERGFEVLVLDIDAGAVAAVEHNAGVLGLANLRAAVSHPRRLPLADASTDCIVSVSVFEGILRKYRSAFWSEIRRSLVPGGSLLMTFDYGEGARRVSDPPVSIDEVRSDIVAASGLTLYGDPLQTPRFDPDLGPPVKVVVPSVDGWDYEFAAYSFGALHLRKS